MLASKYRQNIASVDLPLQVFYVLMLWACCFLGERGVGRGKARDRGIHLWLRVRSANAVRPHTLKSLSYKAQKSKNTVLQIKNNCFS